MSLTLILPACIEISLFHFSKQLTYSSQIDTCLPFSLYLMHGFCSESEQTYQNRVKIPIDTIDDIVLASVVSLFTFNLIVKQDLSMQSDKETL